MGIKVDIEEYGDIKGRLDGIIAVSKNSIMSPQLNIKGAVSSLENISCEIQKKYVEVTGENPWEY